MFYVIVALAVCITEYIIEVFYAPGNCRLTLFTEIKGQGWVTMCGLLMVVCGEVIRKTGVITAASNFTHIIADYKRETHQLVTNGIYRSARCSVLMMLWFAIGTSATLVIWASIYTVLFSCLLIFVTLLFNPGLGTQVFLSNPLSFVIYTVALTQFFRR